MLPTFLIGLREGLEAALVVGILVAYLTRLGRRDVLGRLWFGIGLAVALALAIGAVLTFGAYSLTFEAQELIGGLLSVLTVAMVTWMIFWMQKAGRTMKRTLEGGVDRALAHGTLWALVAIGFVSVAREGIETTLLLWSMVQSFGDAPSALLGALLGILAAAALGVLLARGMLRLDLRAFFLWTGAFLIVVAAGVLAYGIHDLQEAGALPGPFTALAPVDPATGAVAVGAAGFPFGWAFDLSAAIPPKSPLAAIMQATVGFTPKMSWLQVIAWTLYVAIVGAVFATRARRSRPRSAHAAQPEPNDAPTEAAASRPESTPAVVPAPPAVTHQGAP
ncbi:MAG TPA: iron uptake transporter permease EfeU [Microbacterium sp.]|uniref:iron uptake transporter permease EfeU n=1 Tax=Microbacterium sp. TaxID=51671 RepID=UPI002CDA9669|nr:iron uptake transporter permease EfeU [Microbacterium sp.]HWI32190.1 iron uptake transporter permease EfeU [Microbacterium sp.]